MSISRVMLRPWFGVVAGFLLSCGLQACIALRGHKRLYQRRQPLRLRIRENCFYQRDQFSLRIVLMRQSPSPVQLSSFLKSYWADKNNSWHFASWASTPPDTMSLTMKPKYVEGYSKGDLKCDPACSWRVLLHYLHLPHGPRLRLSLSVTRANSRSAHSQSRL